MTFVLFEKLHSIITCLKLIKNTIPAYTKWITLPSRDKKCLIRSSAEPEPEPSPLPFEEIHEEGNHSVGPPSSSADSMNVSQTNQAGITTSMARAYTSTGITYTTT
ncbi:MAG: hypothetical protein RR607_04720, partial [Akkermansia sp.]